MVETVRQFGFRLELDESGWPPVGIEWLYATQINNDLRVETLPLFVKGISVHDVIQADYDSEDMVNEWLHVEKSKRSVVWIASHGDYDVSGALQALRDLGCNTESLWAYKHFAIDVPSEVRIEDVDAVIDTLNSDCCAIAFPSFRHE